MSLSDTAVAIKQELTKRTLRGFLLCRQQSFVRGEIDKRFAFCAVEGRVYSLEPDVVISADGQDGEGDREGE
jgi:hypothetical protein